MKIYQHLVRKREAAIQIFVKAKANLDAVLADVDREREQVISDRNTATAKLAYLDEQAAATSKTLAKIEQLVNG